MTVSASVENRSVTDDRSVPVQNRIRIFRSDTIVHVPIGNFAVRGTSQIVQIYGHMAINYWFEATSVVVALTSFVSDEEDDYDDDEEEDEGS